MTPVDDVSDAGPNFCLKSHHWAQIQAIASRKGKAELNEGAFEDIEAQVRFSLAGGIEKLRSDKQLATELRGISSGAEKIANGLGALHDDFDLQITTFQLISSVLSEAGWPAEDHGDNQLFYDDRESGKRWAPAERLAGAFHQIAGELAAYADTSSSDMAQHHAFRSERAIPEVSAYLDDMREQPLIGLGVTCARLYLTHFGRQPKPPASGSADSLGPFGDFLEVILQAANDAGFKVRPTSARRLGQRALKVIYADPAEGPVD